MENSSTAGNLGKRVLGWVFVAAVALLLLKIMFGVVLGILQAVFSLALIVLVVLGVLWALRHL